MAQAWTSWEVSYAIHVNGTCGGDGFINIGMSGLSGGTLDWSTGYIACAVYASQALNNTEQIGNFLHFYGSGFAFNGYLFSNGTHMSVNDAACYSVTNTSQCGSGGTALAN